MEQTAPYVFDRLLSGIAESLGSESNEPLVELIN
jgi:hypothetical protein